MAMIEVDIDSYVERVYFVGDGHSQDWMACVWRKAPDQPWEVVYRFRYYKSREVWPEAARLEGEEEDVKNAYRWVSKSADQDVAKQQLLDMTDFVSLMTLQHMGPTAQRWVVPVQGGSEKFGEVMKNQPWVQTKTVDKDGKIIA